MKKDDSKARWIGIGIIAQLIIAWAIAMLMGLLILIILDEIANGAIGKLIEREICKFIDRLEGEDK